MCYEWQIGRLHRLAHDLQRFALGAQKVGYASYDDLLITSTYVKAAHQHYVNGEAAINIQREIYNAIRNSFPVNGVDQEIVTELSKLDQIARDFKAAADRLISITNKHYRASKRGYEDES